MNRSLAIGFIVIHCICMMMLNNILRKNLIIALEAWQYRETGNPTLKTCGGTTFFVRIILHLFKEIKN